MIYFVQAAESKRIKIGYTAGSAAARMADLQTGSPEPLRLVGVIPGELADESLLHEVYAKYRLRGEWFHPHPDLTRFVALACPHPEHDLLPGDASYQRGYVDALRRVRNALRDSGEAPAIMNAIWSVIDTIDDEYHTGFDVRTAAEFDQRLCEIMDHKPPFAAPPEAP